MPISRREFLKGLGVTVGGIGFIATGYEHLIPYVHQPENVVPGVSTWYATSCRECPAGCAMLMRARESRVVKCEGNPTHPISHSALCARGQAALHGLYDPDRIKGPLRSHNGRFEDSSWDYAISAVGSQLRKRPRIALVSDLQTGSLDALMRTWMASLGSDRFITYEPIDYSAVKSVYGGIVPSFNIAGSDYLMAFGSDFLETWISPVEYAGGYAEMRRIRNGTRGRFVYVGPRVSMTAANADLRILVPPGAQAEIASVIASEMGRGALGGSALEDVAKKYGLDAGVIRDATRGLGASRAPLVLPGWDSDSARAAGIMNGVLGTRLVNTSRPHAVTHIGTLAQMTGLISDMEDGKIDLLVIQGANPAYSLPQQKRFVSAMKRVPMVVSLSSYMDETTKRANWVLPSNTPLESWGDYVPYPDVANLMQPTMGLLFNTRQTGDILIQLARFAGVDPAATFKATTYYEYLRRRWGFPVAPGASPDASVPGWEGLLQHGGRWPGAGANPTPNTGYNSWNLNVRLPAGGGIPPAAAAAPAMAVPSSTAAPASPPKAGEIRLWAFPHIYYYDGRGANRRWLQEIPEPITKAVWGSWVEMHPQTAKKLGIDTDDIVEISYKGTKLRVGAYVWEGIAPDTVAVPIGEGHSDYGRYAAGFGVNVYPLISVQNPPVRVAAVGGSKWVTRIKGSTDQQGREIVQTAALTEPFERGKEIQMPLSSGFKWMDFYPGHKHKKHRWAMVVDLDKCIGCHACVTACYAENNLGTVNPDGIWRRREMSWIRIDRYIDWKQPSAPVLFQPMLCQHCDAAPCEPVCPVFAASHSDEGLNMQIYNRCVGTRYCSNNCPYKVRRFNWFDYDWPSPLHYQLNPDVTVRSRGVMEKCTLCIQRIRQGEILATREGRTLKDGEITPACAQTCPTGAFTFGDLKDPGSRVSKLIRTDPRAYQVLSELNTKTAVIYLKNVVEKARA